MFKAGIGDIFEIKTPAGLAYVQYTHPGGDMGALVRVLPGLFSVRPTNFAELSKERELYFVFYTLSYALRDHQTEVVSHQPIPEWAQPYLLMRWPGGRDQSGKEVAWKIIKASDPLTLESHLRTPITRALTPEQEKLSIHHVWPHPVMVREIARGWTPERAEELRLEDVAAAEERKSNQAAGAESSEQPMRHFLYFPTKQDAERAGERLRGRGFLVEVRRGAGGEDWLALATRDPPGSGEEMEQLRDEIEALAGELHGEYDGWELAVNADDPNPNEGRQKVN
jgi:hypothetical protein